jgi:hypothetical protein
LAPTNKIVASFPPDGCDDTGGKAFPQMRLSALFFWPLFYFALILGEKGPGARPALNPKVKNPPHIAPDL